MVKAPLSSGSVTLFCRETHWRDVNVGFHSVGTLFAFGDLSVVVEESVADRLGNGKLLHGGLIPLVRPSVVSYPFISPDALCLDLNQHELGSASPLTLIQSMSFSGEESLVD